MLLAVSRQRLCVVGHLHENLCLCLCICYPSSHYNCLLYSDDSAPEKRTASLRLSRKGSKPASHHQVSSCGCGSFYCLLDSYPHFRAGWSLRGRVPQYCCRIQLLLLHCFGLHQQQPQSNPLCIFGWKLQEVLQGLLLPLQDEDGQAEHQQSQKHCARPSLYEGGRWGKQTCMTSRGNVILLSSGERGVQWPRTDPDYHCSLNSTHPERHFWNISEIPAVWTKASLLSINKNLLKISSNEKDLDDSRVLAPCLLYLSQY